jgi:DNA-binding PadR family transcriptional regulator
MHRKSPEEEGLLSALIALFCVYEVSLSGYGVRAKLKDWNIEEFLSVSPATIYRSLARLEAGGLLKSRIKKNGRYPASREYGVTPAGRLRYRELMQQQATFERGTHPLIALVGLGSFLKPAQRIDLARAWADQAERQCADLEKRLSDHRVGQTYGKPFAEWLLLDHEIARLKADIRWLKKYIRLLEGGQA